MIMLATRSVPDAASVCRLPARFRQHVAGLLQLRSALVSSWTTGGPRARSGSVSGGNRLVGTGHRKNLVSHRFKYAVFDIKLTYNREIFIPDVQIPIILNRCGWSKLLAGRGMAPLPEGDVAFSASHWN